MSGSGWEYLKNKRIKLTKQFNQLASTYQKDNLVITSDIFKDCCFYVSGFPSLKEENFEFFQSDRIAAHQVKDLVAKHGGSYMDLLLANTTHCICDYLPHSKARKEIETKRRKKIFFVRADWFIDSIKQKKRLPENKYIIDQLLSENSINSFFEKPLQTNQISFKRISFPRLVFVAGKQIGIEKVEVLLTLSQVKCIMKMCNDIVSFLVGEIKKSFSQDSQFQIYAKSFNIFLKTSLKDARAYFIRALKKTENKFGSLSFEVSSLEKKEYGRFLNGKKPQRRRQIYLPGNLFTSKDFNSLKTTERNVLVLLQLFISKYSSNSLNKLEFSIEISYPEVRLIQLTNKRNIDDPLMLSKYLSKRIFKCLKKYTVDEFEDLNFEKTNDKLELGLSCIKLFVNDCIANDVFNTVDLTKDIEVEGSSEIEEVVVIDVNAIEVEAFKDRFQYKKKVKVTIDEDKEVFEKYMPASLTQIDPEAFKNINQEILSEIANDYEYKIFSQAKRKLRFEEYLPNPEKIRFSLFDNSFDEEDMADIARQLATKPIEEIRSLCVSCIEEKGLLFQVNILLKELAQLVPIQEIKFLKKEVNKAVREEYKGKLVFS